MTKTLHFAPLKLALKSSVWWCFLSAIRHKPRIHQLPFMPLQFTHNPTPDLRRVALGCQLFFRLPPVLNISL